MRVHSLYRMRKQTEQQILKNKIAGYGYIDKRDCQKSGLFWFYVKCLGEGSYFRL